MACGNLFFTNKRPNHIFVYVLERKCNFICVSENANIKTQTNIRLMQSPLYREFSVKFFILKINITYLHIFKEGKCNPPPPKKN